MNTESDYKRALEYVILGNAGMIADDDNFHEFEWSTDGDGWNEPESDSSRCFCGWDGPGWVQIDVARTGRPALADLAVEWMKHIDNDVWGVEDGDIS